MVKSRSPFKKSQPKRKKISLLKDPRVLSILIFIGILVLLIECDRSFSSQTSIKEMYFTNSSRPIIAIWNSLIRLFAGSQPIYPFNYFPDSKRFEENIKLITTEAINMYTQVQPVLKNDNWMTQTIDPKKDNVLSSLVLHSSSVLSGSIFFIQGNTRIPAHRNVFAGSLNYILVLSSPHPDSVGGNAKIRVKNEWIALQTEKSFVFDDTYEYEIVNTSDKPLIFLLLTFQKSTSFLSGINKFLGGVVRGYKNQI